jgi:beta-galactosidase
LDKTGDTFLDMRSWGKGIVFVNGHHLGRYWSIGPQQTMYLPGVWLNRGENEIVIFEQQNYSLQTEISGITTPILEELKVK